MAGRFYPADPRALRRQLRSWLDAAEPGREPIKALIVPHAGYLYSGPIAASGYARLAARRDTVRRVLLLGTAHSAVEGLASTGAEGFETPLGTVPVDRAAVATLEALPQVQRNEQAHRRDHALEVQLPFLQESLTAFTLVPLLVGQAEARAVADVLERLWNGPETLIIVSSDLSHYYDAGTAEQLDHATATAITALEPIGPGQACGYRAINGLLLQARRHRLAARTLDLRHSGDTAGPRDQVVGYGAFAFLDHEKT
jgi:AmmeMemoRadiSam system protein B